MKIAVLSSHTPSLFWFRLDMMKSFISAGHTVIAVGQESECIWNTLFAEHNIIYKQIPVQRNGINPIHDLKTLKALKTFMRDVKPDKIFTYQAKTIIYGSIAAKQCGITEVYSLIAGLGSVFRGHGFKNTIIRSIMKFQYKIACKNSKVILFQNKDDRQIFVNEKLTSFDKTQIINGSGVNTEKFKVTKMPDQFAFLFIGRLIRDKGVFEYLEACKALKHDFPDIRCLLVGPYDSNPSALKESELEPYLKDNLVEYFGEQTDVRPYINQCNVYVLPSYHEGTPKTVLEAMASGRAIITTDAPGCRETVVDGTNGYLVCVKSISELTDKMNFFVNQPQAAYEMGCQGRKMIEKKYDVNKVNESIMKIMSI